MSSPACGKCFSLWLQVGEGPARTPNISEELEEAEDASSSVRLDPEVSMPAALSSPIDKDDLVEPEGFLMMYLVTTKAASRIHVRNTHTMKIAPVHCQIQWSHPDADTTSSGLQTLLHKSVLNDWYDNHYDDGSVKMYVKRISIHH